MKTNKYRYEKIISDSLGKDYTRKIERIKEEQCQYCKKRSTMKCRLNVQADKCINYAEK